MASLNDIPTSVTTALKAAQANNGSLAGAAAAVVMREDAHDLQTEINKAIGNIGMLILVGMPHAENTATMTNPHVNLKISFAIAIGEHPILWRKANVDGSQRPFAPQVAQLVAQLCQNMILPGFNPLRVVRVDYVPDKKRQLYEVSLETALVAPKLNN